MSSSNMQYLTMIVFFIVLLICNLDQHCNKYAAFTLR